MADERLRELERRFHQTSALRDEVRYLQAALRSGEITRERMELAAYLSWPAARLALGETEADTRREFPPGAGPRAEDDWAPDGRPLFVPPVEPTPLELWGEGLERWGEEVTVRAAAAAARLVLPRWDWQERTADPYPQDIPGPQDYDDRPRLAVEAAEAWILEPCAQRVRAAREAAAGVRSALEGTFYTWVMDAAHAAASAAVIDRDPPRDPSGRLPIAACLKAAAESETAWRLHSNPGYSRTASAWNEVFPQVDRWLREAVSAELVSWALDRGDPVADRRARSGA